MLTLTRRARHPQGRVRETQEGEDCICLRDDETGTEVFIIVQAIDASGGRVVISIDAPRTVLIARGELYIHGERT